MITHVGCWENTRKACKSRAELNCSSILLNHSTTWLASLYFLINSFKISLYNKGRRHLLMIVLKLEYIIALLRHSYCLFAIYYHTISLMLREYFFGAETLETMHAEMISLPVLSLVHQAIKIFY